MLSQKDFVQHLLNDYKRDLLEHSHEIVLAKYHDLCREHWDPSWEITDIEESIKGLTWILRAWEIIEENNITNPDILESITLPVKVDYGIEWVDTYDIKVARSFAILVN